MKWSFFAAVGSRLLFLLEPGSQRRVAFVKTAAGERLLVAFTDEDHLKDYAGPSAEYGEMATLAAVCMGAKAPFDGLAIDPGGPNPIVVTRAELQGLCIGISAED
jgi:hypothetical protein